MGGRKCPRGDASAAPDARPTDLQPRTVNLPTRAFPGVQLRTFLGVGLRARFLPPSLPLTPSPPPPLPPPIVPGVQPPPRQIRAAARFLPPTMPYSDPKFPVVNPAPSVDDCVSAMRLRDYLVLGGVSAASWGYGYLFGKPVRMPTASTAATIGFTFAGLVVLQDTRGRLMGHKPNGPEVAYYGPHPTAQPMPVYQADPRFPSATGRSTASARPPLDWTNHQ